MSDSASSSSEIPLSEDEGDGTFENTIFNANKPREDVNYDRSLAASHSYLGDDFSDYAGRNILDEGSMFYLPIIVLSRSVLVPTQTIPLHLFLPNLVSTMKSVITGDRTFGVISQDESAASGEIKTGGIGTTAEIIASSEGYQSGFDTLRIKAIGRQRFVVKEYRRDIFGTFFGKVLILPEIELSPFLRELNIRLVNRNAPLSDDFRRVKQQPLCLVSAPSFVILRYDVEHLVKQIRMRLKEWFYVKDFRDVPVNPLNFSYWLMINLPLSNDDKIRILFYDSVVRRLQELFKFLKPPSYLLCSNCNCYISKVKDIFSMSSEGMISAYVNAHGFIHETLTVYEAHNVLLEGVPSGDYSWFPGYKWIISICSQCRCHVGWKFIANDSETKPQSFWGLSKSSVRWDNLDRSSRRP